MSRPRKGSRATASGRRRARDSSAEVASLTPHPQLVPIPAAWTIAAVLVVGLVTMLVFWPALDNEFVNWDDDKIIVDNPDFRGLGYDQLRWMFTTDKMGHYHPLTWMSLGLDYTLWEMDPYGYHLTNVMLHALTAVALYFLAVRLLRLVLNPSDPLRSRILCVAGAWAALVFALHPLRVESVAWATERRDVLSGVFFVLCIVAYLKACPPSGGRVWRWYFASVALLALSLLAKAWGMVMPAILLLLDVYPLQRLRRPKDAKSLRSTVLSLADKLPYLVLSAVFMKEAYDAQRNQAGTMLSMSAHGIVERLVQGFYGVAFYIQKTVWPTGLIPIYEIPDELSPWDGRFLWAILGVLAAVGVVVYLGKRFPALLATSLSYLVIIAPVLGVVQSGPQLVADRYSYLACMGWPILAAGGLMLAWSSPRISAAGRWAITGFGFALVPLLALLTMRQVDVWQDSMTLWDHTLAVNPNSWNAHSNRGKLLREQGRDEEAQAEYQRAVDLNPTDPIAMTNLGNALRRQGRYDEGIAYILRAKEIMPAHAKIRYALARAYHTAGRLDEAIPAYRTYLKMVPTRFEGHYFFGLALMAQGSFGEAQRELQRAVDLKQDSAAAYKALGDAFRHAGLFDEAIEQYRAAAEFDSELAGLAGARAAAEAARR